MGLDLLQSCTFTGPALPEPFVQFELEKALKKHKLLPKTTGAEGKALTERWKVYRRKLRELVASGGGIRVKNCVLEPLVERLGYDKIESADDVQTREGLESGGYLFACESGKTKLRVWATDFETDLDAPAKRGRAYRYSHLRIAQRVLLASGERIGLLTNGVELRILISDPARPDSQVTIAIESDWKRSRNLPDSYVFLKAIASPSGTTALPDIVDDARRKQAQVTKELKGQARKAVRLFVQSVLDHSANREILAGFGFGTSGKAESVAPKFEASGIETVDDLAKQLWREGLIIIYRLLFVLKLETSDDPARAFSFASTSLWRNSFSPSMTLADYARKVIDDGLETENLLENGLRALFRMFSEGLACTELNVKPLGGALFGAEATPVLSELIWGEWAIAHLLDQLLWTTPKRGSKKSARSRQRVHYGPLDVEDLGRVYEALLELEPGIATEPMCRLQRQKLQVVVPVAQGEKYRPVEVSVDVDPDAEPDEEETPKRSKKKTKVEWIEEISPWKFYLRVGLGRKSSGSYYTPHSFVRFLVQETLGSQVEERSPKEDPNPLEILKLKVLDPAMGSGHFLVEACRFLGEKLYEACRLCDERAVEAQEKAERALKEDNKVAAGAEARKYWQRVIDLPDPDDKLMRYLPSAAPEGAESGLSQQEALALCRRLVAVHCLYGVDKNPLAVELAKLSLWLESHAEGLPLTFLDHRLVVGDSLTGPFFKNLLTYPGTQQELDPLLHRGIREKFTQTMTMALSQIKYLQASVGISLSEIKVKEEAKVKLDNELAPFKIVAAAWSGGVMLGNCDDVAYGKLVESVGETGGLPQSLAVLDSVKSTLLQKMIAKGLGLESVSEEREPLLNLFSEKHNFAAKFPTAAIAYDLYFSEVFYPSGNIDGRGGFDVVLGNPPWDRMLPSDKDFFAGYDIEIMEVSTKKERTELESQLKDNAAVLETYATYIEEFRGVERIIDGIYQHQVAIINGKRTIGKQDAFRAFMERGFQLLRKRGITGVVVPSAFHANEGATGIRHLYLENMALQCCYSFENKRKLFEIHSSFKFALIVAEKGRTTDSVACAFYLHDDEWLFSSDTVNERASLNYDLEFIRKTGNVYLNLLELKSVKDLEVAKLCFKKGELFGRVADSYGVRLGRELNMSDDAWRFVSTTKVLPDGDPRDSEIAVSLLNEGYLILHEGKTFHQYNDQWEDRPRYLVKIENLSDKPNWLDASSYYRLAFRDIASATNERTIIFNILPFTSCSETARSEQDPSNRKLSDALALMSISNSFIFDFLGRLRITSHVQLFILLSLPTLQLKDLSIKPFLSHSALRLTCNHSGYASLWQEQLNTTWRESNKAPFTWPVLTTNDERWAVRAAIDAVVAQAYGLSRDQYAHILSTFSHKSYPQAPDLCLTAFDELTTLGLDAFTRKHDPYHDIPLNESLPKPVIDIPMPAADKTPKQMGFDLSGNST